ncbi:acyl-CoA N-acyltransferase [Bisporella sp. PMI_857]|nr:acyl-CoA N-acyltransferase [Bisporella sp. PMI_857]
MTNMNASMVAPSYEPEGPLVTGAATAPSAITLKGQHVTLGPLSPSHAPDLYTNVGGMHNADLWKYMVAGPFSSLADFTKFIEGVCSHASLFPFAILSSDPVHVSNQSQFSTEEATAVGFVCYINIATHSRSIEIGNVMYASTLQRTTTATETIYLLIKHAFEDLGFSRVEWKCNDRNAPSKRAAERLGFRYEGLFRWHMVVKGRRRDTTWFSIVGDEWEGVKGGFEGWLSEGNFEDGKQVRKLEDIRKDIVSGKE